MQYTPIHIQRSFLALCTLCTLLYACGDDSASSPIPGTSSTTSAETTTPSTSTHTTPTSTGTTGAHTTPSECSDDEIECNGACIVPNTVEQCGSCLPCTERPGTLVVCQDRACVYQCEDGQIDANEDPSDGCECTPSDEVCDGIDNDCDGQIDEDTPTLLNTCTDGPQATAACVDGTCVVECEPGFTNLDGDPTTGCECQGDSTTDDLCDGIDNNCDGVIDEDTEALLTACANVSGAQATTCTEGSCTYRCTEGMFDANDDLRLASAGDGCECTQTHGGAELCDGIDNDCDGQIDEGDDLCPTVSGTNPAQCQDGECVYTCAEDFVDANGDLSENTDGDGCECQPTGPEVCDGRDNDCDNLTDEEDDDYQINLCTPNLGVCAYTENLCQDGSLTQPQECSEAYIAAQIPNGPPIFEGFTQGTRDWPVTASTTTVTEPPTNSVVPRNKASTLLPTHLSIEAANFSPLSH